MPPVHTTGVNWDSVATIVAALTVVMSAILGMCAKLISNQITRAIDKLRIQVIAKLETRITSLEDAVNRSNRRRLP